MIAYVGHIEKQTRENTDFRRVLFTGKHAQLVVMCLEPGEQIGAEVHQNVDQFFRIEQGAARFVFNEGSEHLVREGTSNTAPLKLSTLYSPPNHPEGTVHKTKAEAEAAEVMEHR